MEMQERKKIEQKRLAEELRKRAEQQAIQKLEQQQMQ